MEKAGRFLTLPGLWHSVLGGGQKEGEQITGYNRFFLWLKTSLKLSAAPGVGVRGFVGSHLPIRMHTCLCLGSAKRLDHHSLCVNHESSLSLAIRTIPQKKKKVIYAAVGVGRWKTDQLPGPFLEVL